MKLTVSIASAALLMAASLSQAAADPAARAKAASQTQPVNVREAAEKSCNDALDHDRFDYDTMEECVSETMAKLQRTHHK